jgi:ATP-dependent DNA helicase DinG
MSLLPAPSVFGLPEKFISWRQYQPEAITGALNTDKRFYTTVAPVGSGKSLSYITSAILHGGRAIILTSTKPLQTQLLNDFSDIGLVDIRGRNAYRCRAENDGTTCDHGPCIAGARCPYKEHGCLYFDALEAARRAKLVSTNYACWMTQEIHGEGLGKKPDLLVCDEAHDTPGMLDSFLTIEFDRTKSEIKELLPNTDLNHLAISDWRSWARAHLEEVEEHVDYLKSHVRHGGSRSSRRRLAIMKVLLDNIETVSKMPDDWVFESDRFSVRFSPVWPAKYAEDNLFLGIKKVIMTSGSVRPKTLEILGIGEDDNELKEFPHTFPLENRRIYHIPTVQLNRHTKGDELAILTTRVDQIIRNRQDRKGLIHTVSYDRRDLILGSTKFLDLMITHKRAKAEQGLRQYLRVDAPAVLISPAVMTGVDLPYNACRFQIILKIPYPSTQGALMGARRSVDPAYPSYIAGQQLTQAYGRPNRAPDDFSETFILDDSITWFRRDYASFMPEYFHDAFVSRNAIPSPPKLGGMRK